MAQLRPRPNLSSKQLARHALSVAKRLENAVEKKYVITVFERAAISSSGALFFLNSTVQGTGDVGERIGDQIRCCRLRFSLQFTTPPTLTGAHALRMAIVSDKQNVMANAGALYIGVASLHAPMLQYTKDYHLQYHLLCDTFPINLDTYNPSVTLKRDLRLRIPTRYIQGSDEITSGALKVIFISDMPGSSPTYPSVTGTIRIDYTDN